MIRRTTRGLPDDGGPARPNRRDFLRAGSLAALAPGLALGASRATAEARGIFLCMVGGPSHLDTFDPKPDAPAGVRGPFRAIETNVPGVRISEIFPRLARRMDRVAVVRGLHHASIPTHDAGHQLIQTGRLALDGPEHPHVGAGLSAWRGDVAGNVLLGGEIGPTGGDLSHGQSGGTLGDRLAPRPIDLDAPEFAPASPRDLGRYGSTRFGLACLRARQLVESGAGFVTVNMFSTVFGETTWDCHGSAPFGTLDGYRTSVGPAFDAAYSALLDDLADRGLLATTIVAAAGEFGRTPQINRAGGRDHHPACGAALLAGGPIRGGVVVGESDERGERPRSRPIRPEQFVATIYRALGVPLDAEVSRPDGSPLRLVGPGVDPLSEIL